MVCTNVDVSTAIMLPSLPEIFSVYVVLAHLSVRQSLYVANADAHSGGRPCVRQLATPFFTLDRLPGGQEAEENTRV